MTQATPTSIPLLHGRYRIDAKLGIGRLAVVYRAHDERLHRTVLIHMLRPELVAQEPLRQRFIDESHASARRSHPSLLEVFDSGDLAGRPYMITEYVAGRTLRELGALSLEDALLYFRQVVGAVAACQAAGVPHPPISSNNLILVEDGHVELLENWLTPPADIARDIACYRAPERTEGQAATPASSVYALGLLLYEMLLGRRVMTGDDPRAIAQLHLTSRIPPLAEVRPTLYIPELERLLLRVTARDPGQRLADAATLGQELDRLRRSINSETQRLAAPPVHRHTLRQRINRTAGTLVTPPLPSRPASVAVDAYPNANQQSPALQPTRRPQTILRSLSGLVIMLALFLTVACGAYYVASVVMERLANIQLPRPEINLPQLPDLGIELPGWLTGVVSGRGEVLIVESPTGLRLRDGPGLNTNTITVLPNGTRVRKIEGPQVVDEIPWVRVRAPTDAGEVEGWLSENLLKSEAGAAPGKRP